MTRRLLTPFLLVLLLGGLTVAGCSEDTKDKVGDAAESAKDDAAKAADDVSARGQAEALRTSLKGNATADEEGIRSVKAIEEASKDLAGDPTVTGIEDGDGDGLDDDGKVQVTMDESDACVVLPEEGEDTEVTSEAC